MDLFVVWALDITNTRFFHSYTIHPLLGSNIPLIGLRSNKKKKIPLLQYCIHTCPEPVAGSVAICCCWAAWNDWSICV